jgi:pimeloyl-ACP methyl ester carboxylesterase
MKVEPFKIAIADSAIDDLQHRLAATRWPDEINDDDWSYGTRLAALEALVRHWQREFDWRKQEAALNRLPQFRATVDGFGIHFVHQRGVGPKPFPLIITHGWPGSFVEMVKILPLLTDPGRHGGDPVDAFDVVAPSLPGYGFSDRPAAPGMSPPAVARLWSLLMDGLGYRRYGVQGGDWGAVVSAWLARNHPDPVAGFHVNLMPIIDPPRGSAARPLSDAETAYLEGLRKWAEAEYAYGHIQGTKPQTLAYALNDSPAGLAGWILEKFRAWSDCAGDPSSIFTADELLTNIAIYWFTATIGSSMRLYREQGATPFDLSDGGRVTPPFGFARFPKELSYPPREWAERVFNVVHWTDMPRGGHFAAMEQPQLMAEDIRAFFRPLRG